MNVVKAPTEERKPGQAGILVSVVNDDDAVATAPKISVLVDSLAMRAHSLEASDVLHVTDLDGHFVSPQQTRS